MNDRQLLCFLTLSRTLNFTAAARELYCTQPALSYQIRNLEKELDLALFTRSTTQAGDLAPCWNACFPSGSSWAKLPSFPIHHARFHSGFLGQV